MKILVVGGGAREHALVWKLTQSPKVEEIYITRQMDAATRRIPFQKKIGAGMSVNEYRDAIENHKITGHVGLEQSIQMIQRY